MKLLGYRSADSMLRHESPAELFAAARLLETEAWQKRMTASYAKIQALDFESRPVVVVSPTARRWQLLAEQVVATQRQYVLGIKELGTVVLLPLPASEQPKHAALLSAVITLQALNEVRAAGTFLKLEQMKSGFGKVVQQVALHEPFLPAESLDLPVSWHSLQQFFARSVHRLQADMFEPAVTIEELAWHSIEEVLARIEPSLEFWHGTAFLAMLHAGQTVSLNIVDALLSHTNGLAYEQRLVEHGRKALETEVLLRYLNLDKLEQLVLASVGRRLAPESVIA
jgi:hypothetical protein